MPFERGEVGRLIDIKLAASRLWHDMLPHDYDPYWSELGFALGHLDEHGNPAE